MIPPQIQLLAFEPNLSLSHVSTSDFAAFKAVRLQPQASKPWSVATGSRLHSGAARPCRHVYIPSFEDH